MKSMKALSVNRMLGSIRKKSGNGESDSNASAAATIPGSTPEATAQNSVRAFCESGGSVQGDDVLFLPPIVDAAESSPTAAAECGRIIRKYMSKDYASRPSWQYNAVMLVRILTDNPGATFTRSLDQKFVDTTKALLKNSRDPSVRQILMETLDDFEHTRMDDVNLLPLVTMWKKEKEKALKEHGGRAPYLPVPPPNLPPRMPSNTHSQNYFARSHRSTRLPEPVELASRLEEARTSAKLLEQVLLNTLPAEMLDNDLIKEFADRCLSASRSIQGYMVCDDPAPDNDTMENLIDTNEQLQTALNQHQRAVLNARKIMAEDVPDEPVTNVPSNRTTNAYEPFTPVTNGTSSRTTNAYEPFTPVSPVDDYIPVNKGKEREYQPYSPPPGPPPGAASSSRAQDDQREDPFADPHPDRTNDALPPGDYGHERLAYEPFHPGFNQTSGDSENKEIETRAVERKAIERKPIERKPIESKGKAVAAGSGSSASGARRSFEVSDEEDDDIYDSDRRGKEPASRV